MLQIREETPADYDAIRHVNDLAFGEACMALELRPGATGQGDFKLRYPAAFESVS